MDAQSSVAALEEGLLRPDAIEVIQVDGRGAGGGPEATAGLRGGVESQRPADHARIVEIPRVIADRPPPAFGVDLDPALTGDAPVNKANPGADRRTCMRAQRYMLILINLIFIYLFHTLF